MIIPSGGGNVRTEVQLGGQKEVFSRLSLMCLFVCVCLCD